uniref:LytR/AlgR family response regulator transcription factor n=1 Tax=Acetatifactor sp. TaxID=1872090 RepID=UPI00405771F1
MIKVMVVEDEREIRKILRKMIEKQDGFEVVSDCGDFVHSIGDFLKYKPDVVFMDIDLNGESGLDCAKNMTEINPKVKIIFATAHSEFMANAFEIYAFDYLVKPFNMERLEKTLQKLKDISNDKAGVLSGTWKEPENKEIKKNKDKLMIKGKEQLTFVDTKDIIMVERVDGTTLITTVDDTLQTSATLGSIEEKLDNIRFMRCHKSYIINLSMISKIETYGRWTYIVKLKNTKNTALMTAQKYEEVRLLYE